METIVEIRMAHQQFGATLLLETTEGDGNTVIQFSRDLDLKDVKLRIVQDTEVAKTELSMVRSVSHGINKNLIHTNMYRPNIRWLVLTKTIVEILMDQLQFGAILQIQKRDAKTVNQL